MGQEGGQSERAPAVPAADTEDRLRSILDSAHEAFVAMDAGGFVTEWNRAAEQIFGWAREEVLGRVLADTIVPERFREAHLSGLTRFLETGEGPVLDRRIELSGLHREGYEMPLEVTIAAAEEGARPVFHAFLHDISVRRRAERQVAAQQAVTEVLAEAESVESVGPALLEALGVSMEWEIGTWWIRSDGGEAMVPASTWKNEGLHAPRFEALTRGLRPGRGEGLPGRVWETGRPTWIADVAGDSGLPRAEAAVEAGLRAAVAIPILSGDEVRGAIDFHSRAIRHFEDELQRFLESLTVQIGRFFTVLEQRERAFTELESLATTDPLTGLANRRAWDLALRQELARARRRGRPLCVALLDLDRFKAFNDTHGHPAGDELLREAAAAWRALLRTTDVIARHGGEEFALAFPAEPAEAALAVVERLRQAVPGGETCSAGLVTWDGTESAERLVARADAALYEAKRGGRDRTVTA